ncbi:MAG: M48 family metallopeptidase [Pirellulales bacterium]
MSEEIHQPAPEDASGAIAAQAGEMTAEQLAEAKRYGRQELVCALADKALDVAYLAVAAFLLARPVVAWLAGMAWLPADSLQLVALFLLMVLGHMAVSFPLSYYSGHVLEHRYGLSRQTFSAWLWRYAKRNALAIGFGAAMFVGLYWVIWLVGPWWWLVAAGAFFLVSVVLGQLAPVLILPLFYKIERLDNAELAARMARLAEGTGMSIEGVYRMAMSEETAKANAMLAGLGRTRRVLLGDTLLEGFTADEIEVIFAHEIGHHVFRHLPKQLATGLVFSAAGFWVCDRLVAAWVGRAAGAVDYSRFPIDSLPMLMLVLTLFAMLLEPLQNFITRRYERQSDRYALARTGLKDAYISAFRKLARLNKDDPNPNPVEVFLFHSHPPIAERLAMAEEPGAMQRR